MKPLFALILLLMSQSPAFAQAQQDADSIEVSVRRIRQDQQRFFEMHASGFVRRSQKKG